MAQSATTRTANLPATVSFKQPSMGSEGSDLDRSDTSYHIAEACEHTSVRGNGVRVENCPARQGPRSRRDRHLRTSRTLQGKCERGASAEDHGELA